MKLTDSLRKEYKDLFESARITNPGAVKWAADRAQRNFARYESVSEQTGVPAGVIAVLHCLEASFDFGSHLHNGDPLTARTVQVPAGRPARGTPPFTWEESAFDALQYDGALTVQGWSIADTLHFLEGFNGWGYRTGAGRATTPPMRSPYLWSMTNHYQRGKYIRDGEWDGNAVSAQVGACALLIAMKQRGLPVFEEEPTDEPKPESTKSTGRPYAPCPVPLPWKGDLYRTNVTDPHGDAVYHLQCALIGLGYLRKPADGELVGDVFNEHVEYAVKVFQKQHMGSGSADGIVGPKTRAVIEDMLTRAREPKPIPLPEPKPPADNSVARLICDAGDGFHAGSWAGLRKLTLVVGSESFSVASGARGRQTFRRPQDPRSFPGNLEPIPQGKYTIGSIAFAGGKDNYEVSHGAGLGPVWVSLDADFSDDRGAFGFHLDSNIGGSPGSAGCVVLRDVVDLKRFVAALRKHNPRVLDVNWNL
jgi:lysozyme family protein/peptidoglycan hydrolase-like protein with peptidoglycan-binding domain